VLGLNPHCGDGGVMVQKKTFFNANNKKIFEKGTLSFGPFPADFEVVNMKSMML
jgi:4-hydroxythreonine-4-phosphate dehydrogenase